MRIKTIIPDEYKDVDLNEFEIVFNKVLNRCEIIDRDGRKLDILNEKQLLSLILKELVNKRK